jgi:hypothetical protein
MSGRFWPRSPSGKVTAIVMTAALGIGAAAVVPAAAAGTRAARSGAAAAPYAGPRLKLIAAQNHITVFGFPVKQGSKKVLVLIDPGIWLASLGSSLQFDVGRASYAKPMTITQIISRPGRAPQARPLPANMLDGWTGLKGMMSISVKDSAGKVVIHGGFPLCPDSFDAERATDNGPVNSPFPTQCGAFDPFPLGEVWGIANGWAIDPVETSAVTPYLLTAGATYTVTESITPRFMNWLRVTPRDATASVEVTVQTQTVGPPPKGPARARAALPPLPASVPTMNNPPRSVLPDMVPLPAWNINPLTVQGRDWLNFAATVWIGGNGPLDVEGFRSGGSRIMPAWQYFYQDGKVIGRTRAGTMGFDSAKGHDHWHFEQFAKYQLLDAGKKLVVRSQKVGFCIAPSDQVDMLLPGAVWQVPFIGFGGQCGSPTALWVREQLPLGWGDTYLQFLAGQAFDITSLPNGTYYLEVVANPEHVLHETSYANDVSLRKIIISGKKGHRHVFVPAYFGVDQENSGTPPVPSPSPSPTVTVTATATATASPTPAP